MLILVQLYGTTETTKDGHRDDSSQDSNPAIRQVKYSKPRRNPYACYCLFLIVYIFDLQKFSSK
jgi:hypothetical protein